jgi:hypothetical protein
MGYMTIYSGLIALADSSSSPTNSVYSRLVDLGSLMSVRMMCRVPPVVPRVLWEEKCSDNVYQTQSARLDWQCQCIVGLEKVSEFLKKQDMCGKRVTHK